VDYALPIEENHQDGLHTRLLKSQFFFFPWRGFCEPCSGLTFSGRIVGKTRLIASYNLLKKSHDHCLLWRSNLGKLQFSGLTALESNSVEQSAFSQIFNYNLSHCVLANVHLAC
jgi:hypothetical protein